MTKEEDLMVLAMPRGRILDEAIGLFKKMGWDISGVKETIAQRGLIATFPDWGLRIVIVRDSDVPVYVDRGVAHIGIAGRDVLDEASYDLYETLDLGIGRCRMVVAEPEVPRNFPAHHMYSYATKFPFIAAQYLRPKGEYGDIIKLSGSMEIAPVMGLADRIIDIVSTGETLRQHKMREIHTIMNVSARLCVNRAFAKMRSEELHVVVEGLRSVVEGGKAKAKKLLLDS